VQQQNSSLSFFFFSLDVESDDFGNVSEFLKMYGCQKKGCKKVLWKHRNWIAKVPKKWNHLQWTILGFHIPHALTWFWYGFRIRSLGSHVVFSDRPAYFDRWISMRLSIWELAQVWDFQKTAHQLLRPSNMDGHQLNNPALRNTT